MVFQNYDDAFEESLKVAKRMIMKISDQRDRTAALKYITMTSSLCSGDQTVKRCRNEFFDYFLTVLEAQLEDDERNKIVCPTPTVQDLLTDPLSLLNSLPPLPCNQRLLTHMSEDNTSYVAVKMMAGGGALVYLAVSSDPLLGWDSRRKAS